MRNANIIAFIDPVKHLNSMTVKTVDLSLCLDLHSNFETIALNRQLYQQLFQETAETTTDDQNYISVRFIGSDALLSTNIYPIIFKDKLGNNEVELHSVTFLEKYGTNFTIEKAVINPVHKVPTLTHVCIAFPSEIYNILQTKSQDHIYQILCEERGCYRNLLVRLGDIFPTLNGKVVYTEPYQQGFIDKHTSLTVVKAHETRVCSKHRRERTLILKGLPEGEFVEMDVASIDSISLKQFTRASEIIPEFFFEDETMFTALPFDIFQTLSCFSGDIVKVSAFNYEAYVRVFPFREPSNFPNKIHISPSLSIFLGNPNNVKVSSFESTLYHKLSDAVPMAQSVNIARLSTPINLDKSLQPLVLANLKTYFETAHRIVRSGQIIPIPLDTNLAITLNHTYSELDVYPEVIPEGLSDSIAWFKITESFYKDKVSGNLLPVMPGKPYFVNSQKTTMIQSGLAPLDIDDTIISNVKRFFKIDELFPYTNVTLPGSKVTFSYAKSLRKIYETAIKTRDKININTTVLLTSSTRFVGKSHLVKSLAEKYGYSVVELHGFEIMNSAMNSLGVTIGIMRGKLDRIVDSCSNVTILLKDIDALCKNGDDQQHDQKNSDELISLQVSELIEQYTSKGAIFIATTNNPDGLNDHVRSMMKFELEVTIPTEAERNEILNYLLHFKLNQSSNENYKIDADVNINALALQTAALTPNDLHYVVDHAKICAYNRIKKESNAMNVSIRELNDFNSGFIIIKTTDFEESINKARNKFSDSIGAPRIPNVKWEDVGGLEIVKNEILDTIEMPLKHPELFGSGMKKRSGLLFYGPPGTGKTLLAKAIATNFSLNFFSVKGPELLNMYIGESEANVRRVFQKARDAKPCVIFFDELDSVAPRRGNQGDSGGVMDRIVSQLLAELDGMSGSDDGDGVFVVGASNRPDLLDEALLRPGRFDKMLYLGIPDTHDKQTKIIEALSRKFDLDSGVDLQSVGDSCPLNFTGADFYALCSDAMLNAMIRTATEVDEKLSNYNISRNSDQQLNLRQWFDKVATDDDIKVVVKSEDFNKARKNLVASVSTEELAHYLRVKENFEGAKK